MPGLLQPDPRCRRGAWRRTSAAICLAWLAVAFNAGTATAWGADADPPQVDSEAPSPAVRDFGRGLLLTLGPSLFTRESALPAVAGSMIAAGLGPFDDRISGAARGGAPAVGTAGGNIGSATAIGALTGGLFAVSRFTGGARFRQAAFALAEAEVADLSVVSAMKVAVHRERPDGSDRYSFPSGHASATFALATVFAHYYGWRWGVPLYVVSTLVAAARVEQGKHWPSDVAAGATIGLLFGESAARTVDRLDGQSRPPRFVVHPVVGPSRAAVLVTVRTGRR